MSIPLRWAPGDRCEIEGQLGRVDSVLMGGTYVSAVMDDGRTLIRPTKDVQMVAMNDSDVATPLAGTGDRDA